MLFLGKLEFIIKCIVCYYRYCKVLIFKPTTCTNTGCTRNQKRRKTDVDYHYKLVTTCDNVLKKSIQLSASAYVKKKTWLHHGSVLTVYRDYYRRILRNVGNSIITVLCRIMCRYCIQSQAHSCEHLLLVQI